MDPSLSNVLVSFRVKVVEFPGARTDLGAKVERGIRSTIRGYHRVLLSNRHQVWTETLSLTLLSLHDQESASTAALAALGIGAPFPSFWDDP